MNRTLLLILTMVGVCLPDSAKVSAQTEAVQQFLWKDCREDVITLRLGPSPFEDVVGTGFALRLDNGKALVAILVQDCPRWLVDGRDIGPSQEVHMWVALEGPQDVRPLVGVEQTLPTMTWFNVFNGAREQEVREAFGHSGTRSQPIDDVELTTRPEGRGGTVWVREGLQYSWSAESATPFARFVGVNHDIYGRDRSGAVVLNQVQAVLDVSGWGSSGTMTVMGATDPRALIGEGTYPVRVNRITRLRASASLGRRPPNR